MSVKHAHDSAAAERHGYPELNKGKGNDPFHVFHHLLSVSSPTAKKAESGSGKHSTQCDGDAEALVFFTDCKLV